MTVVRRSVRFDRPSPLRRAQSAVRQWRPKPNWYRPKWYWPVPFGVFLLPFIAPLAGIDITQIIGGLIGLCLLYVLFKRPALCLLVVIPYVALQQVGLPLLWSLGLPGQVARQLGGLKDLLALALLVAAVRDIRRTGRKLDVLDKLAAVYVAVVLLNLVAPQLFYPLIPADLNTRLLAFRYDAGYVLLFFAARHAPLPTDIRDKFIRMLFGLTAVVVAGAVWQKVALNNFTTFMFNTAHVVDFSVKVQGFEPAKAAQAYSPYVQRPILVGSFIVLPHYMADLLLVALAFVLEQTVRARRWRSSLVIFAAIGMTLVFSQVRADLLAAGALLLLVLLPRRGRTPVARVGIVILILGSVVLALPALSGTRVTGGGTAQNSNQAHVGEFGLAIALLTNHPLGIGLGNNPATADRFQLPADQQGALTGDNSWLQVGDELGIPGLLTYTAFIALVFAWLIKAGRDEPFANGALLAFTGIWIAGMFHHVFLSFPQAWALWAAVGLALPARGSVLQTADVSSGRAELVGIKRD